LRVRRSAQALVAARRNRLWAGDYALLTSANEAA